MLSPETVEFLTEMLNRVQLSAQEPNLVEIARIIDTARTELAALNPTTKGAPDE